MGRPPCVALSAVQWVCGAAPDPACAHRSSSSAHPNTTVCATQPLPLSHHPAPFVLCFAALTALCCAAAGRARSNWSWRGMSQRRAGLQWRGCSRKWQAPRPLCRLASPGEGEAHLGKSNGSTSKSSRVPEKVAVQLLHRLLSPVQCALCQPAGCRPPTASLPHAGAARGIPLPAVVPAAGSSCAPRRAPASACCSMPSQ